MRKYQWSYEGMNQPTAEFVDDAKGGTLLNCGYCGKEFLDPYYNRLQECPHCKKDIVFPRADW